MIHVVQTHLAPLPLAGHRGFLAPLAFALLFRPIRRFFLLLLDESSLIIIRQPQRNVLGPVLAMPRVEVEG